jgi:hypothetical protein
MAQLPGEHCFADAKVFVGTGNNGRPETAEPSAFATKVTVHVSL